MVRPDESSQLSNDFDNPFPRSFSPVKVTRLNVDEAKVSSPNTLKTLSSCAWSLNEPLESPSLPCRQRKSDVAYNVCSASFDLFKRRNVINQSKILRPALEAWRQKIWRFYIKATSLKLLAPMEGMSLLSWLWTQVTTKSLLRYMMMK